MYCFSCGKQIPDRSAFCPYCGVTQSPQNSVPPSGPAPMPQPPAPVWQPPAPSVPPVYTAAPQPTYAPPPVPPAMNAAPPVYAPPAPPMYAAPAPMPPGPQPMPQAPPAYMPPPAPSYAPPQPPVPPRPAAPGLDWEPMLTPLEPPVFPVDLAAQQAQKGNLDMPLQASHTPAPTGFSPLKPPPNFIDAAVTAPTYPGAPATVQTNGRFPVPGPPAKKQRLKIDTASAIVFLVLGLLAVGIFGFFALRTFIGGGTQALFPIVSSTATSAVAVTVISIGTLLGILAGFLMLFAALFVFTQGRGNRLAGMATACMSFTLFFDALYHAIMYSSGMYENYKFSAIIQQSIVIYVFELLFILLGIVFPALRRSAQRKMEKANFAKLHGGAFSSDVPSMSGNVKKDKQALKEARQYARAEMKAAKAKEKEARREKKHIQAKDDALKAAEKQVKADAAAKKAAEESQQAQEAIPVAPPAEAVPDALLPVTAEDTAPAETAAPQPAAQENAPAAPENKENPGTL